jgi:phospholipase/carboxylesterase
MARPNARASGAKTGTRALGLHRRRDALLYIPESYNPSEPAPIVVSLHGAGGNEKNGIALLRAQAEASGVILLSPASRESTWDAIASRIGVDIAFLDQALQRTFSICNTDPARTAIGGFSDGASYALTVGLANGDLFPYILAFSPGFMSPPSTAGRPHIFISHGMRDQVLPIEQCSRRIVPRLRSAGYQVDYHEFDGPHMVPRELANLAMEQLTRGISG